jgi:hypothetical protein
LVLTKSYTTIEKSAWPDGPWQSEPDKIQWQDEATGLPCLARRAFTGSWCGYVGVPLGHPCFGQLYGGLDLEVHGGLTYSALCEDDEDESVSVCHVPEPGEPDHVWWLGFDCGHFMDLCPAFQQYIAHPSGSYKDLGYVQEECLRLAAQLAAR